MEELVGEAIAAVKEIAQGGAESVLECVGSESAMATAIKYVGVPHGSGQNFNLSGLFMNNHYIARQGCTCPCLHSRIASRYGRRH